MQKNSFLKLSRNLVYLALFLIPFYFFRFSLGPIKTNVFEVAVFLALVSTLNLKISTRAKFVFGSIWPYLFLLAAVISVFFAQDKVAALGILKGWFVIPAILYFLIINLFDKEDLPNLALPLYLSFSIIAVWGVLQSWQIIGLLFYQKNDPSLGQYFLPGNFRIFGPFESPNYLAMYLAPMFYLVLPVFTILKKLSKWVYPLALIPFGFAIDDIFMTSSRAGVIAFVVALIALIFCWNKKGAKKQSIPVLILIVLTILAATYIFLGRVSVDRGESNSSRLDIYHYSYEMIKTNPIAGIGLGDFQREIADLSKGNQQFQNETLSYALHPHDLYLAVAVNLGLFGLICFFGILINFTKKFWRDRHEYFFLCLTAALLTILIHGLFDTTYFKNDLSAIFWLILAFSQITYVKKNI